MAEETFEITAEGAAALGALTQAFNPRAAEPGIPGVALTPDATWKLEGGTAWVWRVPGSKTLTRPVIMADGFSGGASSLKEWDGLWAGSEIADIYPWGTQLHEEGRDVIVLGYNSRCAPIRDNAKVATQCILKAAQERSGNAPLVVGGLSMGGLVTRYALASLEAERRDAEVGTYFSFDSPHRGAWIPISLQTFAHFMAGLADALPDKPENAEKKQQMKALSDLINSTAAQELLWKHTPTHKNVGPTFEPAQARNDFVEALDAMGSYPQRPRLLGVANGRGDGQGNSTVKPGEENLKWPRKNLDPPLQLIRGPGATLYAQNEGADQLVASLQPVGSGAAITVKTSGIPALDGAPGGTLDSFAIAAHALKASGYDATAAFPDVCFVPVASAIDLADPSAPNDPVNDSSPDDSGLHDYKVASQNEPHTLLTSELCDWLTKQF
ncbi:MAG TPA: hypothetical protein VGO80_03955 [Solirubrobacteraceae bacterium]|jgi:hypothetical protein|nr:hypothetical protein [Solirubrobacteraceae bacterium]